MRELVSGLWIGGVSEFGDGPLLEQNGIAAAVLCHFAKPMPHTSQIELMAINVKEDGENRNLAIKAWAKGLAEIFEQATLLLADTSGGLNQAAFMICCTFAQKKGKTFNQALAWLNALIPPAPLGPAVNISPALIAKGQALWP